MKKIFILLLTVVIFVFSSTACNARRENLEISYGRNFLNTLILKRHM